MSLPPNLDEFLSLFVFFYFVIGIALLAFHSFILLLVLNLCASQRMVLVLCVYVYDLIVNDVMRQWCRWCHSPIDVEKNQGIVSQTVEEAKHTDDVRERKREKEKSWRVSIPLKLFWFNFFLLLDFWHRRYMLFLWHERELTRRNGREADGARRMWKGCQ